MADPRLDRLREQLLQIQTSGGSPSRVGNTSAPRSRSPLFDPERGAGPGLLDKFGGLFSSISTGLRGGDPSAPGREREALILQQNQQNAKFYQDNLNNLAKMTKVMADAGAPGPVIGRFLKTNLKEMSGVVKGRALKQFHDRLLSSLENTTFTGKGTEGTELIEVDEKGFIKGTKEQLMNPSGIPITRPGLYARKVDILPGEGGKGPSITIKDIESAEAKSKNPQAEKALLEATSTQKAVTAGQTALAKKNALLTGLEEAIGKKNVTKEMKARLFGAGPQQLDALSALLFGTGATTSEPTDTKSEAERIVEEVEKGLGR